MNVGGSDSPLVSIVIISHNYARYLRQAILSALSQSYDRTEVIVVDDGSTDESREIILEFSSQIIAHFQEHRGETAANNAGFGLSSGSIVMFLDSDDALHPSAVEEVVAYWHPDASKVQFCLSLVDSDGNAAGHIIPAYPTTQSPDNIWSEVMNTGTYNWPPTTGNAFSRSFLGRVMPLFD